MSYYKRDPKKDHNFDNHPYTDDSEFRVKSHTIAALSPKHLTSNPLLTGAVIPIMAWVQ